MHIKICIWGYFFSSLKTTLDATLAAARAEFLEKGYKSASLRNIVKTAGVTTGAFYGYYKSKEELFDALVGVQYEMVMTKFVAAQEQFASLPPEKQRDEMGGISGDCMEWVTEYVYKNPVEFKLILTCSEGTKYGNLIHDMVEIEVRATHRFAKNLEMLGYPEYSVDPQLEHMLASGLFSAYFELVVHDMPYETAKEYIRDLRNFYTAGWQRIMGF